MVRRSKTRTYVVLTLLIAICSRARVADGSVVNFEDLEPAPLKISIRNETDATAAYDHGLGSQWKFNIIEPILNDDTNTLKTSNRGAVLAENVPSERRKWPPQSKSGPAPSRGKIPPMYRRSSFQTLAGYCRHPLKSRMSDDLPTPPPNGAARTDSGRLVNAGHGLRQELSPAPLHEATPKTYPVHTPQSSRTPPYSDSSYEEEETLHSSFVFNPGFNNGPLHGSRPDDDKDPDTFVPLMEPSNGNPESNALPFGDHSNLMNVDADIGGRFTRSVSMDSAAAEERASKWRGVRVRPVSVKPRQANDSLHSHDSSATNLVLNSLFAGKDDRRSPKSKTGKKYEHGSSLKSGNKVSKPGNLRNPETRRIRPKNTYAAPAIVQRRKPGEIVDGTRLRHLGENDSFPTYPYATNEGDTSELMFSRLDVMIPSRVRGNPYFYSVPELHRAPPVNHSPKKASSKKVFGGNTTPVSVGPRGAAKQIGRNSIESTIEKLAEARKKLKSNSSRVASITKAETSRTRDIQRPSDEQTKRSKIHSLPSRLLPICSAVRNAQCDGSKSEGTKNRHKMKPSKKLRKGFGKSYSRIIALSEAKIGVIGTKDDYSSTVEGLSKLSPSTTDGKKSIDRISEILSAGDV